MRLDVIASVAGIVAGFSITALMFRLQRELAISDRNWQTSGTARTPTWIPPADFLLIISIPLAILGGLVPALLGAAGSGLHVGLAAKASVAAAVLLAGYIPAILAHYNWIFGLDRPRGYTNCWELLIVGLSVILAGWLGSHAAMLVLLR